MADTMSDAAFGPTPSPSPTPQHTMADAAFGSTAKPGIPGVTQPVSGANFGQPIDTKSKVAQQFQALGQNVRNTFAQRAGPPLDLLGKGFSVIDRGRQAVQSVLTTPNSDASKVPWYSTPGVSMLDPGSTDPIDKRVRHAITEGVPPKVDAARQAKIMGALAKVHIPDNPFMRFWVNTGTDPSMFVGDLPAAGLRAAEAHSLPAMMRLTSTLERIHPGTAGVLRSAFSGIHDLLGVDSATKRALASTFLHRWVQEYSTMYGTRAASRSFSNQFAHQFSDEFGKILHGMTPQNEAAIYDAIDKGTVDALPDALKPQAQQLEKLTDDLFYLEADEPTRQDMVSNGYSGLSDWATNLDKGTAKTPATIVNYRGQYVPGTRPVSAVTGGPRRISEITRQDPFLQPREDPIPQSAFEPGATQYFRDAFMRRFASAGRNIAAGDAERKLLGQFGGESFEQLPDHVKQFFDKTIVGDRGLNPLGHAADFGKAAIDLQKGSMFWSPRHVGNIGFLSVLHDIGATPGVIKEYIKTARWNPTQRFEHFAPEIAQGVVQVGGDRSSAFMGLLQKIGGGPQTDAKWSSILRNFVGAPFRIANKWYGSIGDQMWKFDDAAKAVAFRRNTERFLADGLPDDTAKALAAHEVNASLVDYNTRSALADALAYVAPFSTWNTKAPMAFARGAIKSPGIAAAINRASPATMGGEGQLPSGKVEKSSLPGAKFNELATDVSSVPGAIQGLFTNTERQHPLSMKYGTGMLGYPIRVAGNAIVNAMSQGHEPNAFTYGKPTSQYLQSQIPFVGPAEQMTGGGLFPQTPGQALMQNTTGFYEANATKPPSAKSVAFNTFAANYLKTHPGSTMKQVLAAWDLAH